MMDINWIFHVHGGSFFKDIDSLVRDLLTKRLEKIAPKGRCHQCRLWLEGWWCAVLIPVTYSMANP